jgi:hypothetical protein
MLKTPTKTEITGIDYKTDLSNIDSMLTEMSKPKQEMPGMHEPPPPGPESTEPTNHTNNYFDPVNSDYSEINDQPKEFNPEKNDRQGTRIAKMIDGAIGIGAMRLAHADDIQPYKATPGEIEDIGEAWSEYTQDKDINLPPWLGLAFLYVTVYMPRILKAFNDKRLYEQDEKIKTHDTRLNNLSAKYDELLKKQTNNEPQN